MAKYQPVPSYRINAIRTTRATAASMLEYILRKNGDELTESTIRDRWLALLASDPKLLPEGWYQPPPGGINILVGAGPTFDRINSIAHRSPALWPKPDKVLQADSMMFAYCSPVHRASAMIGDFQITLYRGSERRIREHIGRCFAATADIAASATFGMTLGELYEHAEQILGDYQLANNSRSTIGRRRTANVGHTIPWSFGGYSPDIFAAIARSDIAAVADEVRRARIFIAPGQTQRIVDDMAFTIEPQMTSIDGPQVSFHVIVAFSKGARAIYSNFRPLLEHFDMPGYLPADAVELLTKDDDAMLLP
jgi:hypothetical protein